jgi:DNA-3-methyladenine glycosylase I
MNVASNNTHIQRCAWPGDHVLNISYHDLEWGVVQHDDQRLFEILTLEGAQAGLSWLTILNKREAYRRLFANFDIQKVAGFDETRIEALLSDAGIVRHRGKIEATVNNARCILALWNEGKTLDTIFWESVGGNPITNHWKTPGEIPASTKESAWLSKRLKSLGFRFVGETTCYALMQAAGLVNDHEVSCFRHQECQPAPTPE